jgi:hypothetical protein
MHMLLLVFLLDTEAGMLSKEKQKKKKKVGETCSHSELKGTTPEFEHDHVECVELDWR